MNIRVHFDPVNSSPTGLQCGRTSLSPTHVPGVGCPLRSRLLQPHGPSGWHPPPSAPETSPVLSGYIPHGKILKRFCKISLRRRP